MDEQLREKLLHIRMLAMDVDGVLTDGRAFYGPNGFEAVAFHVHDGSAIKWLHRLGFRSAFITGRSLEAVRARAEALGVHYVYENARVKLEAYDRLKAEAELEDRAICYVGDDLTDLPVLTRAGVSVAVADARPEVRQEADVITLARGGRGAIREVAEMILEAHGEWHRLLERYHSVG